MIQKLRASHPVLWRSHRSDGFLAPGTIFFCDTPFTVPLVRFSPFLKEKLHLMLKRVASGSQLLAFSFQLQLEVAR